MAQNTSDTASPTRTARIVYPAVAAIPVPPNPRYENLVSVAPNGTRTVTAPDGRKAVLPPAAACNA